MEMTQEFIDRAIMYRELNIGSKILVHNIVLLGPRGLIVTEQVREYARKHGIDIIQDPTIVLKGEFNHV